MTERVDAYIAYNRMDEAWSKELAAKLERETKDGRPLRVFFAPWDIEEGRNFVLQLNNALERAESIIIVLSPEAIASEWVTREWTSAMLRDVSGSAGRLLPVLRRTCNIPLFLRVLDIVDFRNPLDERPYRELVLRLTGQAKARGGGTMRIASPVAQTQLHGALTGATRPDAVPERLESNLYPIIGLPPSWFSTPCNYSSVGELLASTDSRQAPFPALLIKNRTLFTFTDPRHESSILRQSLDTRLTQEESLDAALHDSTKRPWVMELIKKRLLVELAHRGVAHDRDHDRFFFMKPREGDERKEEWRSPKRLARRMVARAKKSDGIVLRWEHFACYLRIVDVDKTLCLVVEPTWTFTKDGRERLESSRVTALAVRKMYRAGNAAVLNDTRFWAAFMAFNKDEIRLRNGENPPIRISTLPVAVQVGAGLAWDQILPDVISNPPEQWGEDDAPLTEAIE